MVLYEVHQQRRSVVTRRGLKIYHTVLLALGFLVVGLVLCKMATEVKGTTPYLILQPGWVSEGNAQAMMFVGLFLLLAALVTFIRARVL